MVSQAFRSGSSGPPAFPGPRPAFPPPAASSSSGDGSGESSSGGSSSSDSNLDGGPAPERQQQPEGRTTAAGAASLSPSETTMASVSVAFASPPCSPRGEGGDFEAGAAFEGNPFLAALMVDEDGEFPTLAAAAAAAEVGAAAGFTAPKLAPLGLGLAGLGPRTGSSSSLSGIAAGPAAAVAPSSCTSPRPTAAEVARERNATAQLGAEALEQVARAAKVYCQGDLLSAVQTSGVFEDSKEFVDMPMRHDPEVVLQAFHALPPPLRKDPAVLRAFLSQHFLPPGSELVPHEPTDHTDAPALLASLGGHGEYRRWAAELNQFWKQLTRRVSEDVDAHPQRYSLLQRRHAVVIPGGRFRESYYWDSYWIVLGLLACEMKDTARGLVQNLLDDVANFGFVPNGGRIYYLNRSQPPLLSEMVLALVEHEHEVGAAPDLAWLAEAVAVLEKEYAFWMTEGERAVGLADAAGQRHVLNRYYTASNHPRPESFKEDLHHAGLADCAMSFYADIAAGAESGWDFSSRWIHPAAGGGKGQGSDSGSGPSYPLERIATTAVVPVDLNTFLYRMERNLARLHDYLLARRQHPAAPAAQLGQLLPSDARQTWVSPKAQVFAEASARRALAMERLLWDPATGAWKDHWMPHAKKQQQLQQAGAAAREDVTPASNFAPLWGRVLDNPALAAVAAERKAQALAALKASGLIRPGGVSITGVETAEQWDAPNVWSPVVHMVVDGLEGLGLPEASEMAATLAKAWLESNYLGWVNTGYMYEKYNSLVPGARGEGGEYYPQVGFGWTNGVVLHFLKTYGKELTSSASSSIWPSTREHR